MLSPYAIPSDWATEQDRWQGLVWLNEFLDGQMGLLDCAMLYEVARASRGDILELGTWRGKSTTLLAKGLLDRRVPWRGPGAGGCRVYTLDPHTPASGGNLSNMRCAQRMWWCCGVNHVIVPFRAAVADGVLPSSNVRLVFIDDNHKEPVLKANLAAVRKHPSVEQIIVHDTQWAKVRCPAHDLLVNTGEWESADYWRSSYRNVDGRNDCELFRRVIQ